MDASYQFRYNQRLGEPVFGVRVLVLGLGNQSAVGNVPRVLPVSFAAGADDIILAWPVVVRGRSVV